MTPQFYRPPSSFSSSKKRQKIYLRISPQEVSQCFRSSSHLTLSSGTLLPDCWFCVSRAISYMEVAAPTENGSPLSIVAANKMVVFLSAWETNLVLSLMNSTVASDRSFVPGVSRLQCNCFTWRAVPLFQLLLVLLACDRRFVWPPRGSRQMVKKLDIPSITSVGMRENKQQIHFEETSLTLHFALQLAGSTVDYKTIKSSRDDKREQKVGWWSKTLRNLLRGNT